MDETIVSPDDQEEITIPQEIAMPLGMILDEPVTQLEKSLEHVSTAVNETGDPKTQQRIENIRTSLQMIGSVTHALKDPAHYEVTIQPFAGGEKMVAELKEQQVSSPTSSEVIVDEKLTDKLQEAVKHTIGNPLTSLQGTVFYYLRKNPLEEVKKQSQIMMNASRDLVEFIAKLQLADRLKIVSNQQGEPEIIPLSKPKPDLIAA